MRFLFKIALLLFAVSFFLPRSPVEADGGSSAPSTMALVFGAQQAISDLGSFCERAPAACAAGGETLRYAGERVGAGFAYLAALANEQMAAGFTNPPSTAEAAPVRVAAPSSHTVIPVAAQRPTPVNTQAPVPRPYTPPRGAAESETPVALRP